MYRHVIIFLKNFTSSNHRLIECILYFIIKWYEQNCKETAKSFVENLVFLWANKGEEAGGWCEQHVGL